MLSPSSCSAPALGVSEPWQCSWLCQNTVGPGGSAEVWGSSSHLQSLPVSLGSVSTRLVRPRLPAELQLWERGTLPSGDRDVQLPARLDGAPLPARYGTRALSPSLLGLRSAKLCCHLSILICMPCLCQGISLKSFWFLCCLPGAGSATGLSAAVLVPVPEGRCDCWHTLCPRRALGYTPMTGSCCVFPACDLGRWGPDCAHTCNCSNSDGSCSAESGQCLCEAGYTGSHCEQSECCPCPACPYTQQGLQVFRGKASGQPSPLPWLWCCSCPRGGWVMWVHTRKGQTGTHWLS